MADNIDKRYAGQLIGKTVVSKSGKRFGEISNLTFETRTGELLQVVLRNPTSYCENIPDLEKDKDGNFLLPYSAVIALGDFIVVEEKDII